MTYEEMLQLLNTELDSILDASILESRTTKKMIEHAHPLMAQRALLDSTEIVDKKRNLSSIEPGWNTNQAAFIPTPQSTLRAASFPGTCDNCQAMGHTKYRCPSLSCKWCGQNYKSVSELGYHHNSQCVKMPVRQRNKFQSFSPIAYAPTSAQVPRSGYVPPTQTRPYAPRFGPSRDFQVPQSGFPTMGRGFPIPSRSRAQEYQTTHVGYDIQGDPVFEEQPVKMRRLEEVYQVQHVGYDLNGDAVYNSQDAIYNNQEDESVPMDGTDTGYPV